MCTVTIDAKKVILEGAPLSLQGEVITQLVLTHVETRLDEVIKTR